jgi:tRNA(fMet)-specific endonuclease VapC
MANTQLFKKGNSQAGRIPAELAYSSWNALDKVIAAHALALGVTLVTNNEADFREHAALQVENGVKPH